MARLSIGVSADAKEASSEFKALAEDIKKVGTESVGVTEGVARVDAALQKLARAADTPGALAAAVAKAKVEIDDLRASLEKTPASADKMGAIQSALEKADKAMETSIARAQKLKAAQEGVAATLGGTAKSAQGAAVATGKLDAQTGQLAKSVISTSGLLGPYGGMLDKIQGSGGSAASSIAGLALKIGAFVGAAKLGWEAGQKLDAELKKVGIDLAAPTTALVKLEEALKRTPAAARDASSSVMDLVTGTGNLKVGMASLPGPIKEAALSLIDFAKGARDVSTTTKNLIVDIDLESAALTEHTKSLAAQVIARAAARNATREADEAVKAALPGWKSAADQQKELNTTIENTARKFADLQKTGADWKKEVEANQEPLAQFVEKLNAQKVAIETLPEPLQQAIKYLQELKAAAEDAGGAASGIEKLKAAIEGLGSAGAADSIKSIAEALATIRAEGGNTGDAFASNIDAMRELREQAKGSYDTLDAFRKQILDQIPAYQAMALVNEDYVGALDKMDAAYARIAEARRAANEADIEALANMERMKEQARSMATSIDTIGEAWQRATGQVAGFTVEVRTATKAVEETNPGFDAMIEELAKVSDEYGRMIPWFGALIAKLEKGTIGVEDFLVQLDAMNRGFLQIQGMSGNMFGDIGSEVARLTKIINDFVGGERKRTRDSTTRDWRKKR